MKLADSGIPDYSDPAEIYFLPYEMFGDLNHKHCTEKGVTPPSQYFFNKFCLALAKFGIANVTSCSY